MDRSHFVTTSIPEILKGPPLHQLSHGPSGPSFLQVHRLHLLECHKGKACPTSSSYSINTNNMSPKTYSDSHHVNLTNISKKCTDITLTWLGCKARGPLTFRDFSNCGFVLVIWPRHPIKDNLASTCLERIFHQLTHLNKKLRQPSNHRLRE